MDRQELTQYIEKYRGLLVESVEWWQKYTPDVKHGGFYNYLGRGRVPRTAQALPLAVGIGRELLEPACRLRRHEEGRHD